MTYNADESSRYGGRPIELYQFVGTFNTYRYTSHNEDVTYLGLLYTAITMNRSEIKIATPEDGNSDLTIKMAATAAIIQEYAFDIAPPDLVLTLIRYHNPADVVTYWKGPVTNVRIAGVEGSLTSPNNLSTVFATDLPSAYYQSVCNHVLGDARCKINLPSLSVTTALAGWNGSTVTILSAGGKPDGYFINGVFKTPTEQRTVLAHVGTLLTLNYPLRKYRYGTAVTVSPGCNHSYTGDCLTKFNNQINNGGFPFIPTDNPFTDGIA